jgi:beta-glucosidase
MPVYGFPNGFLWGTATAAYQIEGAVEEDGRGASIWDAFCDRPGAIWQGQSGRIACDHYHRWKSDLDLMKRLGISAYRFSVAWPRIFPEGTGAPNEQGLDFYDRLVDGLRRRGIEPMLTLYHWDLPLALERKGGWRNRDTARAFGAYAEAVARRLGDRVRLWVTFNEMPCIIHLGHREGSHAPGAKEPEKVVRQLTHHLLVAHGLGVQAVRAAAPKPVHVGLVHVPHIAQPFTERREDVDFARRVFEEQNAWLLDPVFRARYPVAERRRLGKDAPTAAPGDWKIISQPVDFLGINVYGAVEIARADLGRRPFEKHYPMTDMNTPLTDESIYWACRFTRELYNPAAMYITENGRSEWDDVNADGQVEDYARVEYLKSYLKGVHRAIREKLPVRGYFVWSLLDNFEWAYGYSKRFGIVFVNFDTQERNPKASAEWYAEAIRANGF